MHDLVHSVGNPHPSGDTVICATLYNIYSQRYRGVTVKNHKMQIIYTRRSVSAILHNYIPLGTRMRFGFPVSNIDVNALLESKGSGCTSEVFDKMQQHETKIY